MEVNHRVKSR